jgi:hypothetical protein
MEAFKYNRRNQDRFHREIKARYLLKKKNFDYQDCELMNISRTGAKVKLPEYEKLTGVTKIILEVFTSSGFEQISIPGLIKWVVREENGIMCGIEFSKKIDEYTLAKLG